MALKIETFDTELLNKWTQEDKDRFAKYLTEFESKELISCCMEQKYIKEFNVFISRNVLKTQDDTLLFDMIKK